MDGDTTYRCPHCGFEDAARFFDDFHAFEETGAVACPVCGTVVTEASAVGED